MSFRADLHCHTICSDGTDTPIELIDLASQAGLSGLSITDHDTIDAYTEEVFERASKWGIALLPGVEISSEVDEVSVHVLGYGFDLENQDLRKFLESMRMRRQKRNQEILRKLEAKRMPISEEELNAFATDRTVGRPHIAQLMVLKGYVPTLRDAFEGYLKEGAPCYASGIKYHPQEVIEKIHQAKGKAVLAHPHFIKQGEFLKRLLALKFDGLECYYARLDKALEKPWVRLAKQRNLIATGGSDYHGKFKPQTPLGCSWVGEDIFKALSAR